VILPASYQNGFAPRDGQPLYPSLWKGCRGAWNPGLGPTGLTLRDWSGRSNHGTLTNGSTFAASQGKYAISFDGSSGYLSINSNVVVPLPCSISFYINTTQSTTGIIFEQSSGLVQVFMNAGSICMGVRDNGSAQIVSSVINNGKWHHIMCVWESATSRSLFTDGKPDGTSTASASTSLVLAQIGRRDTGSLFFAGSLTDIFIHSINAAKSVPLLATRRGIAYEMAPRRRSSVQVTTNRRRRIIIGGNR